MPRKNVAKQKAKAKGKAEAKAKAKAGSKKRQRPPAVWPSYGHEAELEEDEALEEYLYGESPEQDPRDDAFPEEEDDIPLSSMLPPSKMAKKADPKGEGDDSLPSFTAAAQENQNSQAKEDEDDQPIITAARLGQQTGEGDGAEGDVWHRLEQELQAPLHAAPRPDEAEDANVKSGDALGDFQEDSDDDWGIKWRGSATELPGASDVLDEIAQKQATSTNWHKQEWAKQEDQDEDPEEEEQWGINKYTSEQDKKKDDADWKADLQWICGDAFSNSREAMAVENVVRKIRARAHGNKESGAEYFPNDTMLQVLKLWVKKPLPEQRILLAVMLYVEAMTLDVEKPTPDLNSMGLSMLTTSEHEDMRNACKIAPPHLMLIKADSEIPDLKLRKEYVPKLISQLKQKLSSLLAGTDVEIDEDDLGENVDTIFVEQPATVRIMGLVHCCEYVLILKRVWDSKTDLFNSLAKQAERWRIFQVLCRVDILEACRLAKQTLEQETGPLRNSKIACLNRLASEWKLAPREEDMMLLHMLRLDRQIQVLLSIERDVELKWCDLMAKVDERDERSSKLRDYLKFTERLRPYLNDEDRLPGKGRKPIEGESGQRLAIGDLAMVRQGVSEILKKLKQLYRWKPDMNSRKVISKTNWVARLAAVLKLVKTTYTLSADKELRKFLQIEGSRSLGNEIYKDYLQWRKAEQGDGLQKPRRRVASERTLEERNDQWDAIMKKYYPENTRPQTHQPQTPAGLGVAAMTPGLAAMTPGLGAAMTPGLAAAMTPGLNPATPGFGGTVTPGYRAPTPTGNFVSGFTPRYKDYKENSEGNTPQWRPSSTPLGPSGTFTPLPGGTPGRVNMRTPFGQPPLTPGAGKHGTTPFGFPPTPGAQPMTPPVETKVKDVTPTPNVKAET